jgi:hypothetical protein
MERTYTESPHVAQGHRLDRVVEAGHLSSLGQQRLEHGAPLLCERKLIPGVALDQALITMAVAVAPVTPARAHSVPEATQNSRTRSETLSPIAMFAAPFIGRR